MTISFTPEAQEDFPRPLKSIFVRQFVDEDLGNSSYLVACEATGVAAVIDPQRDVEKYVQTAQGLGLKLSYALDTHLHADFISGAHELAHRLGAPHHHGHDDHFQIGVGMDAAAEFHHVALNDGDRLQLGDAQLGTLFTPGHTPEHISFAAYEKGSEIPGALFSGGSVIVGGTGRPDLLGHEHTIPLAHHLYRTVHERLSRLPDDVLVYPTHGAGSFCNTSSSGARFTTIGQERRTNPFFQLTDEDAFVQRATTGLSSYPTYYRYLRAINQRGAAILGGLPSLSLLSPAQVARKMETGAAVIDVRSPHRFLASHIPRSYGIPLTTPLLTWAGWVVPFRSPVILVADTLAERNQAVIQLIRIGYDNFAGCLEGGLDAWEAAGLPVVRSSSLSAGELRAWLDRDDRPYLLDVRSDAECAQGCIPGAQHIEAGDLPETARQALPADRPLAVYCGSGFRSIVALSLLEQQGFSDLYNLEHGIDDWVKAGYPTA